MTKQNKNRFYEIIWMLKLSEWFSISFKDINLLQKQEVRCLERSETTFLGSRQHIVLFFAIRHMYIDQVTRCLNKTKILLFRFKTPGVLFSFIMNTFFLPSIFCICNKVISFGSISPFNIWMENSLWAFVLCFVCFLFLN